MLPLRSLALALAVAICPVTATGQDFVSKGKLPEVADFAVGGKFSGKPPEFEDYGYLVRGAAWRFPAGRDRVIPVCWENPTEHNDEPRRWVRDQIERTWQGHTAIAFRGWQKCGPSASGIRILWSDEGPYVKKFGRKLDGVPGGMVLNSSFDNWSPECQPVREGCVRSIAVHEFGHALGFAHEQNRPDTPGECSAEHGQGQTKEVLLTPYDAHSVMNYCNPKYNNHGQLSGLDIKTAQKLYGNPK